MSLKYPTDGEAFIIYIAKERTARTLEDLKLDRATLLARRKEINAMKKATP